MMQARLLLHSKLQLLSSRVIDLKLLEHVFILQKVGFHSTRLTWPHCRLPLPLASETGGQELREPSTCQSVSVFACRAWSSLNVLPEEGGRRGWVLAEAELRAFGPSNSEARMAGSRSGSQAVHSKPHLMATSATHQGTGSPTSHPILHTPSTCCLP